MPKTSCFEHSATKIWITRPMPWRSPDTQERERLHWTWLNQRARRQDRRTRYMTPRKIIPNNFWNVANIYFLHLLIWKNICHACIFFVHDGIAKWLCDEGPKPIHIPNISVLQSYLSQWYRPPCRDLISWRLTTFYDTYCHVNTRPKLSYTSWTEREDNCSPPHRVQGAEQFKSSYKS